MRPHRRGSREGRRLCARGFERARRYRPRRGPSMSSPARGAVRRPTASSSRSIRAAISIETLLRQFAPQSFGQAGARDARQGCSRRAGRGALRARARASCRRSRAPRGSDVGVRRERPRRTRKSPDRVDALVWALTDLMLAPARRTAAAESVMKYDDLRSISCPPCGERGSPNGLVGAQTEPRVLPRLRPPRPSGRSHHARPFSPAHPETRRRGERLEPNRSGEVPHSRGQPTMFEIMSTRTAAREGRRAEPTHPPLFALGFTGQAQWSARDYAAFARGRLPAKPGRLPRRAHDRRSRGLRAAAALQRRARDRDPSAARAPRAPQRCLRRREPVRGVVQPPPDRGQRVPRSGRDRRPARGAPALAARSHARRARRARLAEASSTSSGKRASPTIRRRSIRRSCTSRSSIRRTIISD